MLTFKSFLEEQIISIGFNPKHEPYREKYRDQFYSLLHNAYKDIGGYAGHISGSNEESDAIHNDISNLHIKAVKKKNGVITTINVYKPSHGRKLIATATNKTEQSKKDWTNLAKDDIKKKRSWAEVSGAVEHLFSKLNSPKVKNTEASTLTGKSDIEPNGEYKYSRKIGNERHEKTIMGHPKK